MKLCSRKFVSSLCLTVLFTVAAMLLLLPLNFQCCFNLVVDDDSPDSPQSDPHARQARQNSNQYYHHQFDEETMDTSSQGKAKSHNRKNDDLTIDKFKPRVRKKPRARAQETNKNGFYSNDNVNRDSDSHSQDYERLHNTSSNIIHTNKAATQKLPQAIIVGVKKSGTRALLEFIKLHPDVRAPGPEMHFFDRYYNYGLDWYRSQMPVTIEGQVTMEKTPSYFIMKDTPRRIRDMDKHTKLVIVVRNPVTRAISDYTQTFCKKPWVGRFETLVFLDNTTRIIDTSWNAIRISVYSKYLEVWLRYFPLDQMHFVSGELLISDPAGEMAKVQDFLGLKRIITEKHFYFNDTKGFPCLKKPEGGGSPHCLGKSKGRLHPHIDDALLYRLIDFYRPFNAKFYQMVNKDFGWP